ncbi:MAG: porin [Longimicrobiales bacterium]
MESRIGCGCALLWLGVAVSSGQRVEAQEPAPRIEVKVGGYAQVQFNTTSVEADGVAGSQFEIRRARPTVEVAIDEWITAKLQLDLAGGGASLTDGYIDLSLGESFNLLAGQAKKPFSLILLTSSSQLPVIEREARIRGAVAELGDEFAILDDQQYAVRDVGVQVHGRHGRFGWAAGVFNGEGLNRPEVNSRKSFAGRATVVPLRERPLQIGTGFSYRETAEQEAGGLAADRSGTAFEVDAEWGAFRRPGIHALLEVSLGDNLLEPGAEFLGAHAIVARFWPRAGRIEGLELAGRASFGDPVTEERAATVDDPLGASVWLFTPGVNAYFTGRNRAMLNWDVRVPGLDGLDVEHALRAQLQLYF